MATGGFVNDYTIACIAFFSLLICVISTYAWVHQSRGQIVMVAGDPVESPSSPIVSANEAILTLANTNIPVPPPSAVSIGYTDYGKKPADFSQACFSAFVPKAPDAASGRLLIDKARLTLHLSNEKTKKPAIVHYTIIGLNA